MGKVFALTGIQSVKELDDLLDPFCSSFQNCFEMGIEFGGIEVTSRAISLRTLGGLAAFPEMRLVGQTQTLLICIKTRVYGTCPVKANSLSPLLDVKWNTLRLLKC